MDSYVGCDALLREFVDCKDDAGADQILAILFRDHVRPVVNRIVRSRLSGAGAERDDAAGDAVLQILKRLRALRQERRTVGNLAAYVNTTAVHVCVDKLRRTDAVRAKIARQVRYVARRGRGIISWRDASQRLVVGFPEWRGLPCRALPPGQAGHCDSSARGIETAITMLLTQAEGPLPAEAVISVLRAAAIIEPSPPVSEESAGRGGGSIEESLHVHEALRSWWGEIQRIPIRQRVSLLFNLRDETGADVMTLLPATRVATLEEIARVVEMPGDLFERLWKELPLQDRVIGDLLGISPKEVVKSRRLARERLWRRRRALESSAGRPPAH